VIRRDLAQHNGSRWRWLRAHIRGAPDEHRFFFFGQKASRP
jgi:hypothetical protein